MQSSFSTLFSVVFCSLGYLAVTAEINLAQQPTSTWQQEPAITLAQVTSDGTVNTQVNQNGNVSEITGGETREGNLFHSFREFSVRTGNEAFFNHAESIENIFSRVTGGNISNIDGLIRANDANLFLINPAGIIFGQNARLDIGGSFYGSSASSILFEDGEFSAVDNLEQPLLTINAPIGLGFRDQPGDIILQGTSLNVAPGENLSLLGGNLNLDAINLTALGGTVNLVSLLTTGTVTFDANLNIDVDAVSLGDITLDNVSTIRVNGNGNGAIALEARNINLSGASTLTGGINDANSTTATQAGNIELKARETVTLNQGSLIRNNVSDVSAGNGGNIRITATNLALNNQSEIATVSTGNGNTGDINIVASDRVILDNSIFQARVAAGGVGDSGNIAIDTGSLLLQNTGSGNFSQILSDTAGQGNAGSITIEASNDVSLTDSSFFLTQVEAGGVGDAGDIDITTTNLSLSGTNPNNPASLIANSRGNGNAGNIKITARGNINFDSNSSILSQLLTGAVGNGGNIIVSGDSLNLRGADWITNTRGTGNAGSITIDINNQINLSAGSLILSQVQEGARGDAGDIKIDTGSLTLTNSEIIADSSDLGSAGDINIIAEDQIVLQGAPLARDEFSATSAELASFIITGLNENINPETRVVDSAGQGDAGNINLQASQLILDDIAFISSSVEATTVGDGGTINVDVDLLRLENNAAIGTYTVSEFNAGSINVNSLNLELLSGGKLITVTDGAGNAGTINLEIADNITIDNAGAINAPTFVFNDEIANELQGQTGLFANATGRATGNGGNILIGEALSSPTTRITVTNGSQVRADGGEEGDAGNIALLANSLFLDGNSLIVAETSSPQGGNVTLQIAENINLNRNSLISAEARGTGNGGNLNINADFIIAFPDGNNDIIANAQQGQGGNIEIEARSLFGIQERALDDTTNDINASSDLSLDGNVTINTPDINPVQGVIDLPNSVITPEATVTQTCQLERQAKTPNSFVIKGKGGIPATPVSTLDSQNIFIDGKNNSEPLTPPPIETSRGKIQPARGIKITSEGKVILTAYPTNNAGDRLPTIQANCGN